MQQMNETQENGEMSMDEILASIRRYVNNDDKESAVTTSAPEVVHYAPQPAPARIISMDPPVHVKPRVSATPSVNTLTQAQPQAIRLMPEHAVDAPSSSVSNNAFDGFISLKTENVLTQALSAIKENAQKNQDDQLKIASHKSMDDFMIELLRPLVKKWLDDNLPALVQDLLQKEIGRITGRL